MKVSGVHLSLGIERPGAPAAGGEDAQGVGRGVEGGGGGQGRPSHPARAQVTFN